jgi:hypothetical protein
MRKGVWWGGVCQLYVDFSALLGIISGNDSHLVSVGLPSFSLHGGYVSRTNLDA